MASTSIDDQRENGPDNWLSQQLIEEIGCQPKQSTVGLCASDASSEDKIAPYSASPFVPKAPKTLAQTGLEGHQLEAIILKFLLNRGVASGNAITKQVKLSFSMVAEFLRDLKEAQLVAIRQSSGALGDFEYQLTEKGIGQAKRHSAHSTYFGAAPVPFNDYVAGVAAQSVSRECISPERLQRALADLSLSEAVLSRLGQAMTAGRALFLYGQPGNGKTSVAERLTSVFGSDIWIPRAIMCDGEIVRVYDPVMHEAIQVSGLTQSDEIDERWIHIRRPTIVAGGELTMNNLEITVNPTIGILEAPLQLKSNCGTLVIDDFGRQQMRPDELLNRWIVPLEKQHDYLNFPSGKKVQVPFDQVIVFATNLDPQEIVDEAFLRRIPYKILAVNPSETEFRNLLRVMAAKWKIAYCQTAVDYLIETHYQKVNRSYRYCHPRDLLLQIKHLCTYHSLEPQMTNEYFDIAVENYFASNEGLCPDAAQ